MAKAKPEAPTTVRLLLDVPVDGVPYKGDQIVTFPPNLAAELIDNGFADASPEAVAYIADLGVPVIVHQA